MDAHIGYIPQITHFTVCIQGPMNKQSDIESWMSAQTVCPWLDANQVPDICAGELHLWWVPLQGDDDELRQLRDTLSVSERDRAGRYRFARHRNGYIFGRGVLRLLLSAYTGQAAAQIGFRLGPYGKPSLLAHADEKQLCFNYSDANGHALYGFILHAEIGVDVEDLERRISFERIVERKFGAKEATTIMSLPEHKRKSAFLACWTRKEGYGKAQGWGINYPLDSVELCLDCVKHRVNLSVETGDVGDWVINQLYPSRHFVGTVVYPANMESSENFVLKYMTANPARILQF